MAPNNKILLSLLPLLTPTSAFFLMPCWPITTQRLDPIVNPGAISAHVHQIAGGNAFAPNMSYTSTQASDVCTTCFVQGDHSNYWIPRMYYAHPDGTYEGVDQVGSASMYYFNEPARLGPGEKMEPFPEGLRMLAGNPDKRTAGTDFASQAINYKCLNYAGTPTDSAGFPDHDCADGVRAEVTYPSCWDGQNLDSSDHKSHMAYPTGTFESGACPSTHPHHLVTLKVEFIFDTHKFAGQWSSGKQPFVWSSGDNTGYGLHADFVMGWDLALLTSAVEQCMDEFGVLANCPPFQGRLPPTSQTFANPGTCTVQDYVNEDVGGIVSKLPGCNPVGGTSSLCDDGATLKGGSWGIPGPVGSAISSLVGGIMPTKGSSAAGAGPSEGAPAGQGSGVASPAAVTGSAGGYGGNPNPYTAASGGNAPYVPMAPSSGAAFYEAPAASSAPVAVNAVAATTAPVAPSAPAPAAASPAAPQGSSTAENMGADGRRTRTVWDIMTVTEYVTGDPPSATGGSDDGKWKREAREYINDRQKRHAHGKRHGWW